jgi:hypothetical protein
MPRRERERERETETEAGQDEGCQTWEEKATSDRPWRRRVLLHTEEKKGKEKM